MNPEQWLSLKWNGGSTMSDRWLNQSKIIHAYAGKVQRIPIAFKSKEAKEEWEDEIKNRSEIISRKKLEVRIYTFVTCSYERENNRTYVYAIERKNTK